MRIRLIYAALGIFFSFQCIAIEFTGSITGTVVDAIEPIYTISNIKVDFYNSTNHEHLGSSVTNFNGFFNSGNLPIGSYRIMFKSTPSSPASFYPKYLGNLNGYKSFDFCSSTIVEVTNNSISNVNENMLVTTPIEIIEPVRFKGEGRVYDTETDELIKEGLQVTIYEEKGVFQRSPDFINPGVDGDYSYGETDIFSPIRIRVSDTQGKYFPQYYNADPNIQIDDFCASTALDSSFIAQTYLLKIPLTENIISQVNDYGLPADSTKFVNAPLVKAIKITLDQNQNNDKALCGHMNAFKSRLYIQLRKGLLTNEQLNTLVNEANAVKVQNNCPI